MDPIFDETRPIYLQIKHHIYSLILRGEYKPGDKLPGVIDAAMQYKVNHNTIQRAYQEMIREDIAISRRGEGTFITRDAGALQKMQRELQDSILDIFIQQMRQFGYGNEEIVQIVRNYITNNKSK